MVQQQSVVLCWMTLCPMFSAVHCALLSLWCEWFVLGLTNDAPRGVLMMELCEPGDLKTQDFGPPVPDQRSECKSPGPVPRSLFKGQSAGSPVLVQSALGRIGRQGQVPRSSMCSFKGQVPRSLIKGHFEESAGKSQVPQSSFKEHLVRIGRSERKSPGPRSKST